jgi:ACT domain-containing protein
VSRRFLTSEDVRQAGAREITVEEGTLVTPQAQDEAERLGVVIRTAAGAWREPVPDRGPDARRAQTTLPHLPEPPPDEQESPTGVVVTAVGRNRPGILAEITALLGQLHGDVLSLSQKVTGDYFHLILLVNLPPEVSFEEAKQGLQCLGGEDDYVVRVMHERVFRFMHRV